MADEIIPTAAAPVAAPIPEASAPAAAPTETSPSVTATSQEVKPETTAAPIVTTVLGSETKTEEKPVEVKTEVAPELKPVTAEVKPEAKPEEKQAEVKIEEKPIELPSYEWKFPEGVQVDQDRMSVVNKVFGEMERDGKISHEIVQKYGQQLADFHVSEVQAVAQKVAQAYDKVWKDQTKSWYDEFVKDPEIGGNRQNTTVNAANEFIRRHAGTPEQQTELRSILEKTGLGNHRAIIRAFANANIKMGEAKPVKAEVPASQEKSTLKTKMYGRKKA